MGCVEPGPNIPATVYTHHREIGNVKPRLLSEDSWEIVDADVEGFHARPSRRREAVASSGVCSGRRGEGGPSIVGECTSAPC